jgi:hypothetical protein
MPYLVSSLPTFPPPSFFFDIPKRRMLVFSLSRDTFLSLPELTCHFILVEQGVGSHVGREGADQGIRATLLRGLVSSYTYLFAISPPFTIF